MDDMPAFAKTSTTLLWCFKIRQWTLMVSLFNIVVSTIDMLQIVFLFYVMLYKFEDDGTVYHTSKYHHLKNTLIVIVGLLGYAGIILINVGFIVDVYKHNVDFIRLVYLYSLVRVMSLFYYGLSVLYPILIISFRRRVVIQSAITVTFECLFAVLFLLYAYMEHEPDEKRSEPVTVELRAGTQTV